MLKDKPMNAELLPIESFKAEDLDGGLVEIAGGSSYTIFIDDNKFTFVRVFLDLDKMNKTFDYCKLAASEKRRFSINAESGLYLEFHAIAAEIGRNYITLKVRRTN